MEGFNHMIDHLGPAMRVWLQDMNAKSFDWSEGSLKALKTSVASELKDFDPAVVAEERDQVIIEIFKAKAAAPSLV